MKIIFNESGRGISFSYDFGYDLPSDLEAMNFPVYNYAIVNGTVAYDPVENWVGVPLYLKTTGALTSIAVPGVKPSDIGAVTTAPSGPAGATEWTWNDGTEAWTETVASARARGTATVRAAYPAAANAWVHDGAGTYAYLPSEIVGLQQVRTGTGNVTVTRKTVSGGATAPEVVNDAAFKVITVLVTNAVAGVISAFNSHLSDIGNASTAAAVDVILSNL